MFRQTIKHHWLHLKELDELAMVHGVQAAIVQPHKRSSKVNQYATCNKPTTVAGESWERNAGLLFSLWPNGSIGPIPQSKRRTIFTQPPHPAPLPPRVSVVESSSALQLGHLPEAGHPQWDVRCLTQAPAALGLKPQLRPAAGFLVKADRLQASDSSHRILCCRKTESITAETVNQSLFLLWQMWGYSTCVSVQRLPFEFGLFPHQVLQQSLSNPQKMVYGKSMTRTTEASVGRFQSFGFCEGPTWINTCEANFKMSTLDYYTLRFYYVTVHHIQL